MKQIIITLILTISVLNGYSQLSGSYTIGGTNPDYASITLAVSDLTTNGVSGPVTFLIRDGIYNQQVSIGTIAGASSANPVLFTSESGDSTAVTWTFTPGSSANYTCRLYGCDYVTLDGLTIRAIGASYARPIDIENGSTYTTIRNCVIEAPLTTNTNQNQSAIYEGSGTNSYTLIENNIISNGSYGVYFDGGTGLEIRNNFFEDQYYMGISVDNCPEVKITGNEILATNSHSSYQAIHAEYCDNQIEIVANKIDLQTGYYGLYLYYCEANLSNSGLIANNFISVGGSSGTGIG
ncbi:MAG: right-handed parallel beta-helix repeat-containing protein, partial [Bacteroidales bacterium]|nr:right-handed parallel beta-helix repeat-containing protein [Bacteroidales bacterium]